MPPPQFHILISAKGSPGCYWFHAPSIPLQPKHKNLFSWRSSWTEELLHLKSLLNGFFHFPLFTLKALPALSIPHKCPVSLCKQHLVLKKITNATHYHHRYKNCSCFAFMNREHGRALSRTAQPCTQAWPGWWKLMFGMNLCSTSTIHKGVLSIQDAKRTTVYERLMASGCPF